ncbi:MAG: 16S rRNA (uracil(1498)-N(3))-methyltransferase [Thermodesulfobacteriota bacterium]
MRRFFVPSLDQTDQSFALPADISHHIITVLRLRPDDTFDLCDGAGLCCRVALEDGTPKRAHVRVLKWRPEAETAVPIELLQGMPKGERFDLVLQKNTELGVSSFVPVYTGRCQGRIAATKVDKKLQRWSKIVQEAARQSGRSWLPRVGRPRELEEALKGCTAPLRLVLWEEAEIELSASLPQQLESTDGGIAVLVGPEGGLTSAEVECTEQYGFIPVRFGPRILRTETAGFGVVAVLQYLYGDTGKKADTGE